MYLPGHEIEYTAMKVIYAISALYFLSSVLYGTYLWSQKRNISRAGLWLAAAGALAHTALLAGFLMRGEALAGSTSRPLFIFSWLMALAFLASQTRFRTPVLGAFALPVAFIGTVPYLIIPSGVIAGDPTLSNPWIVAHIFSVFLGEAFFAMSFIAGLIYMFQESRLKSKRVGSHLMKLPSLTTLDRINHLSLLIGFPLLTASLVMGFVLAREIWSDSWTWGAKETWSTVTWILYAFLINGRLSLGWRGRRAAAWAVAGFCIVMVTFAVGYVFPGQHRFG